MEHDFLSTGGRDLHRIIRAVERLRVPALSLTPGFDQQGNQIAVRTTRGSDHHESNLVPLRMGLLCLLRSPPYHDDLLSVAPLCAASPLLFPGVYNHAVLIDLRCNTPIGIDGLSVDPPNLPRNAHPVGFIIGQDRLDHPETLPAPSPPLSRGSKSGVLHGVYENGLNRHTPAMHVHLLRAVFLHEPGLNPASGNREAPDSLGVIPYRGKRASIRMFRSSSP